MIVAQDAQETTVTRAPSLRKRLIPAVLVVIAAVLVGVVALIPEKPKPTPATEVPAVNVKILHVQPIDRLDDTLALSAVVEPDRVVRVAAEVAGRIERFGRRRGAVTWRGRTIPADKEVEEGEPISRGDPIVYLNTELLQARFDRAKAQHEYDEVEFQRIADLYERQVTSKTEFDAAVTKRSVSKATLDEAARNLERAQITAPISGFLNRLPMEIGEYVSPGDHVAEIVSLDRVKVVVNVPERDVHYLRVGDVADVFARGLDQSGCKGEISYISELSDAETRTSRLEITVANPEHELRSGQIVRARLTRRRLEEVIMIPLGSVIPLEEGRVVYIVADGRAQRREVELGLIRGRSVRVLSGLEPGDQLIVAGHRYVGPDQPVTVVGD